MDYKFEIQKSNIEGKGIFTTSAYKKGETICEFEGDRLTIKELKQKYNTGDARIDDPFQIESGLYLDLYKPYIYFNHSCNPNAGVKRSGTLFALRDINSKEEIFFDYSTTEWTDDKAWGINWTEEWIIKCKCGENNCRKEIRVFPLLPQEVKDKYYRDGALMDFILDKFIKNP